MAASTETERAPGLYQELDASKNQIRLMTLEGSSSPDTLNTRCRLSVVSLYDDPTYIALSYAWGDPNITEDISVNDIPLPVTTNLMAALRRLYERYSDKQVAFWIDAICINQQDLGERGHQVKIMGQIYSRAQTVIGWLGEMHIDFSTLPGLSQEGTERIRLLVQNRHALRSMLDAPYWRRMWTQQEIILARDLLLLCGPSLLAADKFVNLLKACTSVASNPPATILEYDVHTRLDLGSLIGSFLNAFSVIYSSSHDPRQTDSEFLFDMLRVGSRCLSSDPRDKLYALVSIDEHDQLGIEPDYTKNPATVFVEFVQRVAKKHSVLILNGSNGIGKTRPSQPRIPGLPSWTPDFTYIPMSDLDSFFQQNKSVYNRSPEAEFSGEGLHLTAKGLVIDCVEHFEPRYDVKDFLAKYWLMVCRDEQDAAPYPTGIPKVQAYFRTLLMADSGAGHGEEEEDDGDRQFFGLAVGFMMALSILKPSPKFFAFCKTCIEQFDVTLEELEAAIKAKGEYVFGFLRSTGYVERLIEACFEASGLRGIADMSQQKLLEGFCGHENQSSHLRWKKTHDPEREGWDLFETFFLLATRCTRYDGFFTTRKGYMGLGPGVEQGDIVCALYGCNRPLILRQVDGHYLVVGSCYVTGISGESVEELEASGAFETRHFEMR